MGFYLRKAVSVGPFRFNLSGSGIGVSTGVRGFRVGAGPRGNYVHVGARGIHYRTSLDSRARSRAAPAAGPVPTGLPVQEPLGEIESGSALQMVDSSSAELLEEIRAKRGLWRLWPWALLTTALTWLPLTLVAAMAQTAGQGPALVAFLWSCDLALLVAGVGLTIALRRRDELRKTVVLLYELDDTMAAAYQVLHDGFGWLTICNSVWNLTGVAKATDRKRSAGAGTLVSRYAVRPSLAEPPAVRTNVAVPTLGAGREMLYFLPDRILVLQGKDIGSISYVELDIQTSQVQFIEEGAVPADSEVVSHTWKYVNKKGGPDRRFNDNRQLPVVRYGQLVLQSTKGLNEVFQTSRPEPATYFADSIRPLAHASGRSEGDVVPQLSPAPQAIRPSASTDSRSPDIGARKPA